MFVSKVSREDLLDLLLAGEATPTSLLEVGSDFSFSDGDRWVIWRERPLHVGLPNALIIPKHEQSEFFAWTQTYIPDYRPFTAFCRVLDKSDVSYFIKTIAASFGRFEQACLGIILGEAASVPNLRGDLQSLISENYRESYSFIAARALAKGASSQLLDELLSIWESVRLRATVGANTVLSKHSRHGLSLVWRTLVSLREHKTLEIDKLDSIILTIIFDMAKGDLAHGQELFLKPLRSVFTDDIPILLDKAQTGTREERVIIFESIVEKILRKGPPTEIDSFLCGYLMSLISSGTFDHASLIFPYITQFPNALLWYGLCTGLSPKARLKNFGGGTGQRILREVLRSSSMLETPTCDLAIGEFQLLVQSGVNATNINRGTPEYLDIELAPFLNTRVSMARGNDSQSELLNMGEHQMPSVELIKGLEQFLSKVDNLRFDVRMMLERTGKGRTKRRLK